jgi:protein-disulfide isomerase
MLLLPFSRSRTRADARLVRVLSVLLPIALVLGTAGPTIAQQEDDTVDPDRIVENLKMEIPQLRQAQQVQLGAFRTSDVDGFQQTTLTVNGRRLPLLINDDGTQALLLAGPPIDVSRSVEEVEAELGAEADKRSEVLAAAVDGMPVRGPADAPVTLVEFSDFQCPYCARASTLVDRLLETYPETLNVVYLHYPLPNHEWAEPAAIAAQCAARQSDDAFWTLHDAYFDNQDSYTTGNVVDRSAEALSGSDIDLEQWRSCAGDPSSDAYAGARQSVQANLQAGRDVNVTGTPSFYINGEKVQGGRSFEAFSQAIEAAADTAGAAPESAGSE